MYRLVNIYRTHFSTLISTIHSYAIHFPMTKERVRTKRKKEEDLESWLEWDIAQHTSPGLSAKTYMLREAMPEASLLPAYP